MHTHNTQAHQFKYNFTVTVALVCQVFIQLQIFSGMKINIYNNPYNTVIDNTDARALY